MIALVPSSDLKDYRTTGSHRSSCLRSDDAIGRSPGDAAGMQVLYAEIFQGLFIKIPF